MIVNVLKKKKKNRVKEKCILQVNVSMFKKYKKIKTKTKTKQRVDQSKIDTLAFNSKKKKLQANIN